MAASRGDSLFAIVLCFMFKTEPLQAVYKVGKCFCGHLLGKLSGSL